MDRGNIDPRQYRRQQIQEMFCTPPAGAYPTLDPRADPVAQIIVQYEFGVLGELSKRRTRTSPAVYFVGCGEFVKIGYSEEPYRRFGTISAVNPLAELLGFIPGTSPFERYLHRELKSERHQLEWYRQSPLIVELIPRLLKLGATFASSKMGWSFDRCFPRAEDRLGR